MEARAAEMADALLKRAEEAHAEALKELDRAIGEGKPLLLRNSCEEGWLAVVGAIDFLFAKRG